MIILMKVTGPGQCSLDNLFIINEFPAPDTKKEVLEWTTAGGYYKITDTQKNKEHAYERDR